MPRKLSRTRPAFGAKLVALRKSAGLSQAELAKLIGEDRGNIAFWETHDKPPRSEVLPRMALVLHCTVEDLLSPSGMRRRQKGPVSRLQRAFDKLVELPRRRQDRIIDVIESLIKSAA